MIPSIEQIMVYGPFVIGCVYYAAKVIRFGILRKWHSPWHNPMPMRVWFAISCITAILGSSGSISDNQLSVFIMCIPWIWIMAMGNEELGMFRGVEDFVPLESEIMRRHSSVRRKEDL